MRTAFRSWLQGIFHPSSDRPHGWRGRIQFFAGSRFADKQHIGISDGDLSNRRRAILPSALLEPTISSN